MFASVSFIVMTAYNVLRGKKVEVPKHKCLFFHFVLCKVFNVPFSPSFSFLCVIDSFSLPIFPSYLSFSMYCDVFLSLCTVMCVRLPGLILPLFQQPFYIHANTFIPSMNPFTQPDIPCRTKAHTFLFIHKIDKKTFYFDIVRMIGPFSRQTK